MASAPRFRALLDLCKRRGFLFPSAEIHGGLRGAYDYGPLGAELKRNIANEWWSYSVYQRSDVVGLDTSIITPHNVLKASGHVDEFTDALVDCLLSKERFRPDKAPKLTVVETPKDGDLDLKIPIMAPDKTIAKQWVTTIAEQLVPGAVVSRHKSDIFLHAERVVEPVEGSNAEGKIFLKRTDPNMQPITISYNGYVAPGSNSPFLTASRPFDLMFKTFLDPIDPIDRVIQTTLSHPPSSTTTVRSAVDTVLRPSMVYLRPETAQGVFINYHNVLRTMKSRPPFGIAQMGKSFRNEIRLEHAIFRTPEFEQLELEYFVPPWESSYWFGYWRQERFAWWLRYANDPARFRTRDHTSDELAHYAQGCMDIEYEFPWGWGEVEGVAHRGDYDLKQHARATGERLDFVDESPGVSESVPAGAIALETVPKMEDGWPVRYVPHVVESSCGLNRSMLAYLFDAFDEVPEETGSRIVMRLHPRLAPVKCAVIPLIPRPELMELVGLVAGSLRRERVNTVVEAQNLKIGKRYYRHDEIGTPWCVTVDFESVKDGKVTIRERDSGEQMRVRWEEVREIIRDRLNTD
ncbi:glycyl-tRNA synthetase [Jimgerdemannia flammicorona]|uniref:Glycyl-tRNA synthetase n=2 Tax=Jimgerdemannia flammicorona TaxID=994334 RepID=A0A433QKB9_9FUNG|nr:glycyl-tRNA synthetase [Jimgerdemannia flammicorona]RUS30233.1 glycyl-tRNA synthetase [Jimgerdemannia flammicorona]